jgi:uncharacterized coiled-coil protein SlyX
MSESDLVTRLHELEMRYMHLERYLDELSDVVATQQQTIDGLRAAMKRLQAQGANPGGAEEAALDERPPHY